MTVWEEPQLYTVYCHSNPLGGTAARPVLEMGKLWLGVMHSEWALRFPNLIIITLLWCPTLARRFLVYGCYCSQVESASKRLDQVATAREDVQMKLEVGVPPLRVPLLCSMGIGEHGTDGVGSTL